MKQYQAEFIEALPQGLVGITLKTLHIQSELCSLCHISAPCG